MIRQVDRASNPVFNSSKDSETKASVIDGKEAFLRALRGDFSESTMTEAAKIVPKAKLCIFVSSTFTDTKYERDWMMEEILPPLQEKARAKGILLTLCDMRFGVKDESTDTHDTWYVCADQLKYCHDQSDGLFFLSLQADKYGYRPLP